MALLAVLAAMALATAACSSGGDSDGSTIAGPGTTVDPEAGLTEDTVLFDDTTPDDPGTSGSDDDAPTTDSTTPRAPATTPSLVIDRFGVLGGWTGSAWNNADSPTEADLASAAGATFQTVGFGATVDSVVAGTPQIVCDPIETIGLPTTPDLEYDPDPVIGVLADWDPTPRTALRSSAASDVYIEQIATLLEQNGIDPALASVDSIARVDLEGDGVDEAVVTANRQASWPEPSAGDFSLVLLRKLVDDEVQTAILYSAYQVEEPEEYYWVRSRLVGFGDFNGDAKLEIIVSSEYYEGAGLEVFEYVNDDLGPVLVMDSGCGA